MNKILNILAFDTLYGGLNWGDRLILHCYLSGRGQDFPPTERILEVGACIHRNKWQAPAMKYMKDDVVLYVEDLENEQWLPIDKYIEKYPNPLLENEDL
ncbi:hypothetical protein [Riemerella anatipestifer]|uniref:hypothetical protein n=1 Tax=Riemerella anatipestifer TaxID=34085 RepID=UPI0007EC5FEF|nr:hypothetical protein [Riemerella anatipestifer]AZZ59177.1 hypothetical protein AWB57_09170 [Riemerella anatipestifer]MBT0573755.1 hypothetical protein [Riemerella anatipestifer]MDR7796527.1 hypothetical protein [Riemerella anatipestifer]MDY3445419.1 hypothetical protein [Riemerella anatipestifer]QZO86354.1 hypothetical protein K6T42_06410 [Riemerella anatipestifer]